MILFLGAIIDPTFPTGALRTEYGRMLRLCRANRPDQMVTELAEGALLTAPLFLWFILHGLCIRLGALRRLAMPIQRKWFGENKTYRGVICVAVGTAVGFVVIDPRFLSLGAGLADLESETLK